MLPASEVGGVVWICLWDATLCASLLAALLNLDASAMSKQRQGPSAGLAALRLSGGRRRVWGLASAEHLGLHLSFWTYRSRAINQQSSPALPSLLSLVFNRPFLADNDCLVDHVSLRSNCVEIGQ
jgi:hypothetical protein